MREGVSGGACAVGLPRAGVAAVSDEFVACEETNSSFTLERRVPDA
jgi:hypothetical protein